MNEKSGIYRLGFDLGFGLKSGIFHLKVAKSSFDTLSPCRGRMVGCI